MDDCGSEPQVEAEEILKKIAADFEQLDRAIDSAMVLLKAANGGDKDVEALRRAREAARKGAALAKSKAGSE